MPNWCANKLTVSGRRSDVHEFLQLLDTVKGDQGFFDAIIPMPKELHNVCNPVQLVDEQEYSQYLSGGHETFGGMPITKAMQADYLARFGADNWYDWAVNNWGTKWDVTNEDLCRTDWKNGLGVQLRFDTAWGPPLEVVEALSGMFPKLKISIDYNESGMNLEGKETYVPHD